MKIGVFARDLSLTHGRTQRTHGKMYGKVLLLGENISFSLLGIWGILDIPYVYSPGVL